MTIAQLVHPMRGLGRQPQWQAIDTLRRAVSGRPSSNAMLWRAIGTGFGFALIGLAILALAISTAGVVPPAAGSGGVAVATHATPGHPLNIYQYSPGGVTGAVPVP